MNAETYERIKQRALLRAKEICEDIVEEIQTSPLTPRESGRMAEGYHVEETAEGYGVFNDVDYWHAVEYGHDVVNQYGRTSGHVEPQHHVGPAIEVVRARLNG